jgi:hypothetical protein
VEAVVKTTKAATNILVAAFIILFMQNKNAILLLPKKIRNLGK